MANELFNDTSVKKEYVIQFPNGEHDDITSDNLLSDSVTLTESICSQDKLRFGLCESSQLEFWTLGVPSIKGCEIDVTMNAIQDYATYNADRYDLYDSTNYRWYQFDMQDKFDDNLVTISSNMYIRQYRIIHIDGTEEVYVFDTKTTKSVTLSGVISIKFSIYCHTDELESASTAYVTGKHKSVESIHIGRFIVDSHKRYTYNNSKRRAIAYSKDFYYAKEFPLYVAEWLSKLYFGTQRTVKLSVHDIIAMAFPDFYTGSEHQLTKTTSYYRHVLNSDYEVKFYFNTYVTVNDLDSGYFASDNINMLKYTIEYDREYKRKVHHIMELAGKSADDIEYYTENQLYLELNETSNSTKYQYKLNEPSEYKSTTFTSSVMRPVDSQYYAISITSYVASSSTNNYLTRCNYSGVQAGTRMQLIDRKTGDTVYDTGSYEPVVRCYNTMIRAFDSSKEEVYLSLPMVKVNKSMDRYKSGKFEKTMDRALYQIDTTGLNDINPVELLHAYYELNGNLVRIDRESGYPKPFKLSESMTHTVPTDNILGLIYDEDIIQKYDRIVGKMVASDGKEYPIEEYLSDSNHMFVYNHSRRATYDDYEIKNIILEKGILTTIQAYNYIFALMDEMKIISYIPYELQTIGMPLIEAGDKLHIDTDDGGIDTYVLSRTMSGISLPKDYIIAD